ncbi:hypothetical protein BLNAU_4170 [Blattamonas nauphoetae]|uniref:Uncharacterized protein n=1 Tax=Blattamonas nauphoetae TaxID=2049346 RepID=A0ABQ9YAR2_9EUKA|nr:hypothetical protein BLNAU_4170 [Blattamonas nauphoetae]
MRLHSPHNPTLDESNWSWISGWTRRGERGKIRKPKSRKRSRDCGANKSPPRCTSTIRRTRKTKPPHRSRTGMSSQRKSQSLSPSPHVNSVWRSTTHRDVDRLDHPRLVVADHPRHTAHHPRQRAELVRWALLVRYHNSGQLDLSADGNRTTVCLFYSLVPKSRLRLATQTPADLTLPNPQSEFSLPSKDLPRLVLPHLHFCRSVVCRVWCGRGCCV